MNLFFQPRSVVLIGVSRQTGPGAYNNLETMLRYGYGGRIHVVHPHVGEILGRSTLQRVGDLPEVPDLAVISVGRDRVMDAFAQCAAHGIRRVIVISQGFADADNRGRELQERLLRLAREKGIRLLGPNTMGVLDAFSGFGTAFLDIPRDPSPPPLTVVAQSGVLQVGIESFTGRLGKAIDIGNAADVDFVDVLNFLETDPQTRVIVLHMEGMQRGRLFLETAARVARQKPIIVFKTGRSTAGARAALSHTGSLVGEDAVFNAAFARAGLIRVRHMVELQAVCRAFLAFQSLRGPRLAVVTATGACGIMAADACEDYDLELAPLSEGLRRQLENQRLAWHRLRNPVDIWPLGMASSFTEVFKKAVIGFLVDDGVDAVLGIAAALTSPLHTDLDLVPVVREINSRNAAGKPIALWLYGGDQERTGRALEGESNVACFGSLDEAVMGLSAFWRYTGWQSERAEEASSDFLVEVEEDKAPAFSVRVPGSRAAAGSSPRLLVGEEALALLRQAGIPEAPSATASDEESVIGAARSLGFPVVLKIASAAWPHKSDLGGLRFHLASEDAVRKAFQELRDLFTRLTPLALWEGLLVQREVTGTELLLGLKRDPEFGHVLAVGFGGIYTEVFRDLARALVPVSAKEAEALLRSLRIFPILQGVRGQRGSNVRSVVDAIVALSRLAQNVPGIQELDINPLMAGFEECRAVDARIVLD